MNKAARILIVDNDPGVLLVLHDTRERMNRGYSIEAAHDGEEALEKFENESFSMVITDVRMPGINGVELTEEIRALGSHSAVIWITAYGCSNLKDEHEKLDVFPRLEKPIRISEIRKAAQEALEISYGEDQ
jgi:DNA-binding NtrC family response regulator